MEVFFGYQFENFTGINHRISTALLDRAVKANIITPEGAAWLRELR